MPPPRGTPNPLEGPGDYDMTSIVHSDTYAAIDPTQVDMSGQAVFVSGASRGIGKAIAVAFARAGASRIAIGARSDLSGTVSAMLEAAAAVRPVPRPAPEILSLQLDIGDAASVGRAARRVAEAFGGRLDVLVNNAAVLGAAAPIADSDPEDWIRTLHVNVVGPYLVTRALLPLLMARNDDDGRGDGSSDCGGGGIVVNLASVGAHLVTPGLSAYQTSKLAVLRLSEFVSAECGDKGVVAFSIHPGNIPTTMADALGGIPPEMMPAFVDKAELTADSLVYLTSKKRDWLAGRYINVTWDLPELMAKKDEIVAGDKLKVRLVI